MSGRYKLSNLRSVSITQSPTNKSYSLYLPTRPDFLNFLCEIWCDEEQLGGGFKDETKSVLITAGIVTDVAALESTQLEADTRVILHSYIVFRRMSNELSFTQMTQTLSLYHVCTTLQRCWEICRKCLCGFAPHEVARRIRSCQAPSVKGKGKGMVLYSAVSSPLDRSKRFTLSSPGRPVHSDTVLGFSWKHSSHAAIAQRLFTHISTTVYSQVLIYTAESTEAS